MKDKRFYIIVPEKIQVHSFNLGIDLDHKMEAGRLMAQNFHIGRLIENLRVRHSKNGNLPYEEITAIVLAARNEREMVKIADDFLAAFDAKKLRDQNRFAVFRDRNPDVYGKGRKVLTAIVVGPVTKSEVAPYIGHLELFGAN